MSVTAGATGPSPLFSRVEMARAGVLFLVCVLLWCFIMNRWDAAAWRTPLAYTEDVNKGDCLAIYAIVKAARDGRYLPFASKIVPELGAPFAAQWNDYPLIEEFLFFFTGVLAKVVGLFAAVNAVCLLFHALAALSFYVACRLLGCLPSWSFAGALAFAFARYGFAHEPHHVTLLAYWHIPLCLVVCRWIAGEGLELRGARFRFALFVAVVTGIQPVYYTNMFLQLVILGGLYQVIRHRWQWRKALPAVIIGAVTFAAFLLMNVDTFYYNFANGPNPGAVVREYRWVEIYALKIVDLIVPSPEHRFPPLARWARSYYSGAFLPGETFQPAYLGLLGVIGLSWLGADSVRRQLKTPPQRIRIEAAWVLWILLYATLGGLNGLVATTGFTLFRATTRYSIFLLAIVLLFLVRRLSEPGPPRSPVLKALPVVAALVVLLDQLPPQTANRDIRQVVDAVAADRAFTEKMEARLPPGGMVFQIPPMDFPEGPIPGVSAYNHFRPYLYSHKLRFSFGSTKGRPKADWAHRLESLDLKERITRLESHGFSAVYVNAAAFPDKARGLAAALRGMGRGEVIHSPGGDLFCVVLRPSPSPVLPRLAR
jgi:hypothetical protein